eukprot:jgi/Chrzof1/8911/Cz03g28250.t1
MDPLHVAAAPDKSGYLDVGDNVDLYYELYIPNIKQYPVPRGRVIIIWGAFARSKHFEETAEYLKMNGFEVLLYDHRGVGNSRIPTIEVQTSLLLAEDALKLINGVWDADTLVHVWGASMGGMIAQELAVMLLNQQRLASLWLAVTARGVPWLPVGTIMKGLLRWGILGPFLAWYYGNNKEAIVRKLMGKCFTRQFLAAKHPSGETYQQVYSRKWLERFDDLWTFDNPVVGACHMTTGLDHYLSNDKTAALRNSGVRIVVQVSEHDRLVPPFAQRQLARLLAAECVSYPTGHMGMMLWREEWHALLLQHLAADHDVTTTKEVTDAPAGCSDAKLLVESCQACMSAAGAAVGGKGVIAAILRDLQLERVMV